MPLTETTSQKMDTFFRIIIWVDTTILLLIFLRGQFGIIFPFPLPGKRLNNPLALLLFMFFLRGVVNLQFKEKHLSTLKKWVTEFPQRIWFFVSLLTIEIVLQFMWFKFPQDFHWNLNAEIGYGTHFSAIQLYCLGFVVLITAWADCGEDAGWDEKLPWYLVAGIYFYIGLDDCVGIHENFITLSETLIPGSNIFHFIHEWLWFYAPLIVIVVIFLTRFFFKKFLYSPKILFTMLIALMFWILVILLEGLAKKIVDPMGLDYGRLLIGVEEGSEMFGATLFILGFSIHLKNILRNNQDSSPSP